MCAKTKSKRREAAATEGIMEFAAPAAGEMVFHQSPPFSGVFHRIIGLLKGSKSIFRDKKKLAVVFILFIVWLVLMLLQSYGFNNPFLKLFSFLTFARGGTGGGLIGAIGGIIGKGLFAYFITLPLFSGNRLLGSLRQGLRNIKTVFTAKNNKPLMPVLLGAGLALIGYNFLTGNASLENSMIGIIAFLMALKALASRTGFLRSIFSALFQKGPGKLFAGFGIEAVISGWALGFVLGIPLSATGIGSIGYLAGILLVIAAVVLGFVRKNKEEAAAV